MRVRAGGSAGCDAVCCGLDLGMSRQLEGSGWVERG